jgi:prostaglandin-H2 D-isomerase / glutathione transferase
MERDMSKPKLTYFDAPVSRGEECRLAFHIAGVPFEDVRLARDAWAALKPTTPYGGLPTLELPGKPVLAHANAILGYIGRSHGLHPQDTFEAARHEAMMNHVEDLRANVTPTLRISDEAEKKKARLALAEGYLPGWARYAESQLIGSGPFFAGDKLNVVDIKLFISVRWFASGTVDYVPSTVFSSFSKLNRVFEAVRDDARVRAWYDKKS